MLTFVAWSVYWNAGVVLGLLLLLCLFIILLIADWRCTPPRTISTMVWCRVRRRYGTVQLKQQARFGLTTREIENCSLLRPGESCDQMCRLHLDGAPTPPPSN